MLSFAFCDRGISWVGVVLFVEQPTENKGWRTRNPPLRLFLRELPMIFSARRMRRLPLLPPHPPATSAASSLLSHRYLLLLLLFPLIVINSNREVRSRGFGLMFLFHVYYVIGVRISTQIIPVLWFLGLWGFWGLRVFVCVVPWPWLRIFLFPKRGLLRFGVIDLCSLP